MCERRASILAAVSLLAVVGLFCVSAGTAQDSVAEAARKNRKKDTPATAKRIWTNDNVAPASDGESPALSTETPESMAQTLRDLRLLDKEHLALAVLIRAGAPNVEFASRKDWEQRLFDAKQAWVDQEDRVLARKDANKDAKDEETRLAIGAHRIFERIANEGVQQARAVNDPVLKAHLEYQRQAEFCKQTSGDLRDRCEASLGQLRWKMEREGIW